MNAKWLVIIFALLSAVITVYPPYHWNADESLRDRTMEMQLPIKQHEFLFGPNIREFTLKHYTKPADEDIKQNNDVTTANKHDLSSYSDEELKLMLGIVPLKRSIALTDFILEYLIALIVSLLIAIFLREKIKK